MVQRNHVVADLGLCFGLGVSVDVSGQLVPEEVEIDPVLGFATDFAADDLPVKISGAFFVLHSEGHVKWDHFGGSKRVREDHGVAAFIKKANRLASCRKAHKDCACMTLWNDKP